ncbi:MAG: hypothetical protein AAF865_04715 [Pseudomonadota bacterium]
MWKQVSLLAVAVALAACDDGGPNPVNGIPEDTGTDPGTPTDPTPGGIVIPDAISFDLDAVRWERNGAGDADDQLIVTGVTLDDGNIDGVYQRAPDEDVPGYLAFFKQDDRLDRIFVGLAGETPDGAVRGFVVQDGGQFQIEYGGIFYERDGEFTPPDVATVNGLVSYAGEYAAMTDLGDPEQNLRLDPFGPDGTDEVPDGAIPRQGRTITGQVFVNVDFADNAVNGVIYDRTWSNGEALGDELYILLQDGEIDANGNFTGDAAQQLAAPAPTEENPNPETPLPRVVGPFAGAFGGVNASGMAGAFTANDHLREQLPADPEDPDAPPTFGDIPLSTERGIFVIPRCGSDESPEVCAGLNDIDDIPGISN